MMKSVLNYKGTYNFRGGSTYNKGIGNGYQQYKVSSQEFLGVINENLFLSMRLSDRIHIDV